MIKIKKEEEVSISGLTVDPPSSLRCLINVRDPEKLSPTMEGLCCTCQNM